VGAIEALKADATLGWLSSANQMRALERDAILGAEWGGMTGFTASLQEVAKRGDEALEIGCGGGRVTRVARPLVAHIDAVDVSEPMLEEAKRGTAGVDGIDFWVVEGFGDNLGSRKYDLALSHDVFVHFEFDEVARYACNVADALKPGGRFVVSVYTLDDENERQQYRMELMRKPLHPRRARRMPEAAYDTIWETAGFSIEGRRRSHSSEYAGDRSYTHLNYQLRLRR
jgi:SAM-dependent methyltransferase